MSYGRMQLAQLYLEEQLAFYASILKHYYC